jgi:DNA primase small subunit
LEDFDPLGVPTVQGLLQEIDAWEEPADPKSGNPMPDWEKTSLRPYVEQFRTFVIGLMRDERDPKIKRENEDADSMEF